jgi:acetolactate synthase-1/2/3 large subunit
VSNDITRNNVGLAILTTLRNYGIDAVFGIPGTHSVEFYRHFGPLGIHPVTTRHEQGAGYGADGWSQLTGLPGVVITTSGPGLLNALSAAATAYAESRPMIILSPGAPTGTEFSDIGTLHETKDPTGAVGSIVHRSTRVTSGKQAVEEIHAAFELFANGRPRPVHIEVPLDVLESASDVDPKDCDARSTGAAKTADAQAVTDAAAALAQARRPVIIAGGGATRAAASVLALAEKLQAPVVTTLNGKGVVPESHPLSLGANLRLQAARDVCNHADVLLVIGSKLGEAELWGGTIDAPGTCIRVDILSGQMATNIGADIELAGNSVAVVPQLLDALGEHEAAEATDLSDAKKRMLAEAREVAPELAAVNEIIAGALPAGAVVSGDSSRVTYLGSTTFIEQDEPHRFLYTPCYATLGYGLPAAIGAKVAAPHLPVVCVLGDGALMFAIQELMTAVEQNVDITIVCVDNGGYQEIRQNMLDVGIDPVGVDLAQPNWAQLARGFGLAAFEAAAVDELGGALADAMAVNGPSLVHLKLR